MKLDREYQRKLLAKLDEIYPKYASFAEWFRANRGDKDKFAANITYLYGHRLIEKGIDVSSNGEYIFIGNTRLTSRGIDFLKDDGGLSAILGVVTVKFHEDTIRELLALKINESDLNQTDKSVLLGQLKRLPGESITHLTKKLVELGLQNWEKLPQLIQTAGQLFG